MFMLYLSVAWPRKRQREIERQSVVYERDECPTAIHIHTHTNTYLYIHIYLYIAYKIVNVILFTCIASGQSVLPAGHKLHSESNPGTTTTTTTRRTSLPDPAGNVCTHTHTQAD